MTLINGRRAFATSTNINAIPIGALSRTEILKDGASAVYGSDAVAGVVNFIMLNGPGEAPYEGAELDFLYGNTTDTDAHVLQTYLRGGAATDAKFRSQRPANITTVTHCSRVTVRSPSIADRTPRW